MGNERIPKPLSPEQFRQRFEYAESELTAMHCYMSVLGTTDGPHGLVKGNRVGAERVFAIRDLAREQNNTLNVIETLESRVVWYDWRLRPENKEIEEAFSALEEVRGYRDSGLLTFEEYEDALSAYNNLFQEPQLPPGFNFPFRLFEEESALTQESIPQQDKVRLGDGVQPPAREPKLSEDLITPKITIHLSNDQIEVNGGLEAGVGGDQGEVKTRERKIGRPSETVKFPLPLGYIVDISPRMKDALEVLLVGTDKVPVSADELAEYMFYEELKSGKITLEEARRQVVSNYAWRLNVMFKELKLPYEIVNASKLGEKAAYFVRYPREAEGRAPEAEVKDGLTKASAVQALADQKSVVNPALQIKPILEIPYEPDPEDLRTDEETRILKGVIAFLAEGHTRLYTDRLQAAMLKSHPEGRIKAYSLSELSDLLPGALRKIQRQAKIPLLRQRLSQEDLDIAEKIAKLKARFEKEKKKELTENEFVRILQKAIINSGD